MMSGNCTSKKELLQFIDQVSFAIDDLLLFLDTHPGEKRALEKVGEPAPDCPKGIGRLRSFRQQENHANREGAVVAVCSIIDFETQSLRIVGRHYNL